MDRWSVCLSDMHTQRGCASLVKKAKWER